LKQKVLIYSFEIIYGNSKLRQNRKVDRLVVFFTQKII
jgi:hypothetical protein